jgi:hypothetical protein
VMSNTIRLAARTIRNADTPLMKTLSVEEVQHQISC